MSSGLCIVFVTELPTRKPVCNKTETIGATDTTGATGASGEGVINSHAFTKKTLLEHKTLIITIQDYEELKQIYQTKKTYFNLFMFTIFDKTQFPGKDKSKLCCLIIFMNDVYSYHYVCAIDTIEETKQRFKNIIEKNNMGIKNYSLLKLNFDEDGKFNASNEEPLY
jgi:hypothetical protein